MATITSPRSSSPAIPTITSPTLPSGTNTPTSSIRTSIDLPSSSQPPAQNAAASNQRRNRAALRDYYNLKAKPSPAGTGAAPSPTTSTHNLSRTASIASIRSDSTHLSSATLTTDAGGASGASTLPTALDDPTFDAESYITSLLKTSTLKDILRTESSLVSEIRNLDGERKALVYDNYSKLIVAVGTVGEMQRGIVEEKDRFGNVNEGVSGLNRMKGLESKLDLLMDGFKEMNGHSPEGGDTSVRKNKADQRSKSRVERKKKDLVKWVLDSPARLEVLLEKGQKEEADREWTEIQTLLDQWEGVKGVQEVREQCKKLMEPESEEEED